MPLFELEPVVSEMIEQTESEHAPVHRSTKKSVKHPGRQELPAIRRSIATLAQEKGTVKDVQSFLRHSRAATTTDVYMQEIPESVRATVNAIHQEL
jgi:integrase